MSQSVRRRPVRRRSAAPSSTQTTAVRTPAGQPARTALLLATATAMLSAGTALPAQAAEESFPVADGGFVLEGRGYGHGRGMSQWGSYRQASEGRSWQQIVAFYYPGASVRSLTGRTIRVSTTGLTGSTARVTAEAGLTATDGKQTVALATSDAGTPITAWEVGRPVSGGTSTTTTLWFHTAKGRKALRSSDTGRWTIKDSDGSLQAQNSSGRAVATYLGSFTGNRSGSTIVPVLATNLEDYTRQVVPWENIPSWPVQAHAAQAVGARSYGAWHLSHPRHRLYDICDTTSCQGFKGVTQENERTREGIRASAGKVLTVGGQVVRSEYSASNGGQTAPAGVSYTAVRSDPYELRLPTSVTHWKGTLPAARLQAAWPQVGTVTKLVITSRDGHGQWGGRVKTMRLQGTRGSVSITPGQIAGMVSGWKGAYFTISTKLVAQAPGPAGFHSRDASGNLFSTAAAPGGGFQAPRQVGHGWGAFSSVFTGQFTADSHPDALALNSKGQLLLYPSRGNGSWAPATVVASGLNGYDSFTLAPAFNQGRPAVLARRSSDGALVSFAATGKGSMSATPTVISPAGWTGRRPTAMFAVADATGDRRADLVVRAANGDLLAHPGNGAGRLGAPVTIGRGWNGFSCITTAGDLNRDGRSELVGRRADGTTLLYTSRGSGFTTTSLASHRSTLLG